MSRRRRKRWLSHRRLVMAEGLLLVGVLEMAAGDRLLASSLSDDLKVLLSMLLVLGFFGSLLLVVERWARTGVGTTHRTIEALPIPTPRLVVHGIVAFGLFLAYAWALELWPSWLPDL